MDCPKCSKRMTKLAFADATAFPETWWECDHCHLRLVPISPSITSPRYGP
jgi:hypothetical protein